MNRFDDAYFQRELLARRRHLDHAAGLSPGLDLRALIGDVDAALARLGEGAYHACTVCRDDIELDRLVEDPLARCCREHPSDAERARVFRDLALARTIQRGLLPACCLTIDGWRLRYHYEPASEVGGDFCDVLQLPHRQETLVLVGDVSGKGIAASLLMANLVGTFRSLVTVDLPTADLLGRVNDLFREAAPEDAYATLVAAVLKPDRTIDLYNAGHWPPLLRRGQRTAPVALEPGLPFGMVTGTCYEPFRMTTEPGETLLFFTDGVVEAENVAGEDFGASRLADVLARGGEPALQGIVDSCVEELRTFRHPAAATDDLLLFAMQAAGTDELDQSRVA